MTILKVHGFSITESKDFKMVEIPKKEFKMISEL
jgi:hypothetical protein